MPKPMACDRWLFLTASLLVLGGLLMVGSASSYMAMDSGKSPSAFLVRHAVYALIGFALCRAMLSMPYRKLEERPVVVLLLVACIAGLLVALMMPPLGGARRWILVGPLTVQPSEFAKLAAVVFMAFMLSRRERRINELWAVPLPCLAVVGTMALLVVIEPDLGSAVVLFAAAAVMIFAAGLRWSYLATLGVLAAIGLVVSIVLWPYRIVRILAFLDPAADPLGSGFQLNQSLIALGTGGLTGAGFGQGQQKAFYIPAAHTDFIFSVVGEELGLAGTSLLLLGFLLLFWRGMRAAVRAPDRFGFYLALGITHLLIVQALINMGVCTGLLPTKGLPLPLVSYGGSSLVASMAGIGLLLNVSQHSN